MISEQMSKDESWIAVFFGHVLRDLNIVGMFSVLFGTLLLLSCIVSLGPERLLLGLALVFLAIANYYWIRREKDKDELVFNAAHLSRIKRDWRVSCFLAMVFAIVAVVLLYYFIKLPLVSKFLTEIGIWPQRG